MLVWVDVLCSMLGQTFSRLLWSRTMEGWIGKCWFEVWTVAWYSGGKGWLEDWQDIGGSGCCSVLEGRGGKVEVELEGVAGWNLTGL